MSKLVDFPQRQHYLFNQLVRRAVEKAAKQQCMLVEDYIQRIYYCDENPPEFTNEQSLLDIYQQYSNLIEAAVSTINKKDEMKNCSKAYLCFRIYLHGMTVERNVMPETLAKTSLIFTLREFFYARGKILTIADEAKLFKIIANICIKAPTLRANSG